MLGRFRIGEHDLWRGVADLIENRASYESKIKKKAFSGMSKPRETNG